MLGGEFMKVLFVSDIHGSSYYALKLKEICLNERPDKIVLLGDLYYHGPRNDLSLEYNPMKVAEILNSFKNDLYVVRGNCDAEVDEMISEFSFSDSLLLNINGKRVFCTHGHKYNMFNLPNTDFDVMAYGHIHIGFLKREGNRLFINPGSLSLPKGDSVNSYIIMESSFIYLKDLKGNIIEKVSVM